MLPYNCITVFGNSILPLHTEHSLYAQKPPPLAFSHLNPNHNNVFTNNQSMTTVAYQANSSITILQKIKINKNPQVLTYSWEEGPM